MRKSNPFRKPGEAWKRTEVGIELEYPIFHHDPSIPDDPIIKRNMEEAIGDIDFWGLEGNKEDRIVDSLGRVFIVKSEMTNGFSLFVIPTEFRSGVFPGEVERIMDISEIKEIMISGIERNKIRINENINELKKVIATMDSTKEILTKCANYF